MGKVNSYEDLNVYKLLVELHLEIDNLTLKFPSFERFELGSQIRRSSNSIPANLAEGWNSRHIAVCIEGISRAQGELRETTHHLRIAYRKKYLSETQYQNLIDRYSVAGKMLRNLERAISSKRQNLKLENGEILLCH